MLSGLPGCFRILESHVVAVPFIVQFSLHLSVGLRRSGFWNHKHTKKGTIGRNEDIRGGCFVLVVVLVCVAIGLILFFFFCEGKSKMPSVLSLQHSS